MKSITKYLCRVCGAKHWHVPPARCGRCGDAAGFDVEGKPAVIEVSPVIGELTDIGPQVEESARRRTKEAGRLF